MNGAFAKFVAPIYLLLCIVFGGSQQGIWANAVLQIIAVALLVWVSVTDRMLPVTQSFRLLEGLVLLTLVTIAVQLVPLPPPVWTALPGRELFVEGYRSLQLQLPWLPISEAPYETVIATFWLLPPLAALATAQLVDDERVLAGALLGGAGAAIILGQLQVGATGDQWQLYEFTNRGPVGFFANINHMGTLLLASIPFAVALFVTRSKRRDATYHWVGTAVAGVAIALLLIGVVLNGSLAALLLIGPVLLASGLLLPAGWRLRRFVIPLAVLALVGAVYALSTNPLERVLDTEAGSLASRQEIWATTIKAISDTFPFGTGLGTFETVYAAHEDPNLVSATYVNHAHNDYLQVVLELGAAGILLILLFLLWWGWQSLRIWQSHETRLVQRAATIASAAILAHSVVDYPLRTAAIAAVFGTCLGLMVREPLRKSTGARHVRLG